MKNIAAIWNGLSNGRKGALLIAVIAVFLGIFAIRALGPSSRMELLYSGLSASSAGDVIAALDARNVDYEVRGSAIYVSAPERDRLRMSLASEGLPEVGAKGYELLDSLSGFGTTSQMFDAAYWRAKEGELARTIVAAPHIRSARVHLSPANSRPFQRGGEASAAVTVSTATGSLSKGEANALRHLLAASVDALPVANVSVIDDVAGLIAAGDPDDASLNGGEMEDSLRQRVERMLAARVGAGNAIVEVSVNRVTEREVLIERRVDPESQVIISEENEKRSETSANNEGAVTVASNLPDGDAAGGASGGSSSSNDSRQRVNYEISEYKREVQRQPGDIKRLTVAVLLNHATITADDGTEDVRPRTPEEIESLRGLVASAVGLDTERGDVITIESLPFVDVMAEGAGAGTSAFSTRGLDLMGIIQLLVVAAVVLILGLFVLRPILLSAPRRSGAHETIELTADSVSTEPEVLPDLDSNLPDLGGGFATVAEPLDFGGFDTAFAGADDNPVSRLKNLIAERQEESLQILQSWIDPAQDPSEEAK